MTSIPTNLDKIEKILVLQKNIFDPGFSLIGIFMTTKLDSYNYKCIKSEVKKNVIAINGNFF